MSHGLPISAVRDAGVTSFSSATRQHFAVSSTPRRVEVNDGGLLCNWFTPRRFDMNRNRNWNFAWSRTTITALVLLLSGMMAAPVVSAAGVAASPPANFKKVSSLVKLPDFLPGLGALYVDPS